MVSLQMSQHGEHQGQPAARLPVAAGLPAGHGQHRRGQIRRGLAGEKGDFAGGPQPGLEQPLPAPTPNLPVYISGDRDTLHGDMVKVYETVRAAGIQKVAFMTDSRQSSTTP